MDVFVNTKYVPQYMLSRASIIPLALSLNIIEFLVHGHIIIGQKLGGNLD